MQIGAILDALHLKTKGKPISNAQLARLTSVSPTTVRRWRQRDDYQVMMQQPIDNPDMIQSADEYFEGRIRITAAITAEFGNSNN
jgi:hypothetical protein